MLNTKRAIRYLEAKFSLNIGNTFKDQKKLFNGIGANIIFDAGAYIGKITARYKRQFRDSTIYCFEPFTDSFNKLVKSFRGNIMIKPIQMALADRVGTNDFFIYTDPSCNSLIPRTDKSKNLYGRYKVSRNIQVNITTIDEFCKNNSISRIDILKLDLEGSELKALKGAKEMLQKNSIELIYLEVMFTPHHDEDVLFNELYDFLLKFNYTLFNFYGLKRAENGQLRWGNAIFISKRIRSNINQ